MGQLEDMAMFARIVEAGSMSRVAEQTGIARSAVSRRLAALEQSLNTQLLVRNTRNSTLTDADPVSMSGLNRFWRMSRS